MHEQIEQDVMYYKKGESERMKQDGKLFCLYFGRQLSVTQARVWHRAQNNDGRLRFMVTLIWGSEV